VGGGGGGGGLLDSFCEGMSKPLLKFSSGAKLRELDKQRNVGF